MWSCNLAIMSVVDGRFVLDKIQVNGFKISNFLQVSFADELVFLTSDIFIHILYGFCYQRASEHVKKLDLIPMDIRL